MRRVDSQKFAWPTDQQTDKTTDMTGYRSALAHLKKNMPHPTDQITVYQIIDTKTRIFFMQDLKRKQNQSVKSF